MQLLNFKSLICVPQTTSICFQIVLCLKMIMHSRHTFIDQNKNKVNLFMLRQKRKRKDLKVKAHFLNQNQSDYFFELYIIYIIYKFDLFQDHDSVRLPLLACSYSIETNRLLKLPAPNPWWFLLWITSKKRVGLSYTGLVNICKRYPLSS